MLLKKIVTFYNKALRKKATSSNNSTLTEYKLEAWMSVLQ